MQRKRKKRFLYIFTGILLIFVLFNLNLIDNYKRYLITKDRITLENYEKESLQNQLNYVIQNKEKYKAGGDIQFKNIENVHSINFIGEIKSPKQDKQFTKEDLTNFVITEF